MAKAKDWSKLYKKYKGQWVALADDEETVMGNGKTAKEARDKARARGYRKPIMARMPERLITYVGGSHA